MIDHIAIYGAGGLGRELHSLINQINSIKNQWTFVGYIDDRSDAHQMIYADLNGLQDCKQELKVLIGIGDPQTKKDVCLKIRNPLVTFPVVQHPTAVVGDSVQLGQGTCITAGCILTTDIKVGQHVLINLNVTVGHDAIIGDFSSIMPGVNVSGGVNIHPGCMIGTGAQLLPNVSIGANSKVGAGAVVTKDVPANTTVVGIPARPL